MDAQNTLSAKAVIAMSVLCLLGGVGCRSTDAPTVPEPPALSLRNMTNGTISYSIKAASPDATAQKRLLKPGDIDRFPPDVIMDIAFEAPGKTISYRLSASRPYTFRYDENDVVNLYEGSHGRKDVPDLAPFVATPPSVVEGMLMLAKVTDADVLYDLGCGDGRIVIAAAKHYGAHGVGIELDPELVKKCQEAARREGVDHLVSFRVEDATKTDFTTATLVALYLLPESNELLRTQLERQLKPGARVVTHNYHIPGWESKQVNFAVTRTDDGVLHEIYLYRR